MPHRSRHQLQLPPLSVGPRDVRQLHARDEKAVILEQACGAIPPQDTYKGRRRGSKAGPPDVNPILQVIRIPPDGLDLDPEKAVRRDVSSQHLHRLQVGKRPEEIERFGLSQPPHYLHLAEKTLVPAINSHRQCVLERRDAGERHDAESLGQLLASDKIRSPARVPARVQLKRGGQVLAAVHLVVHRELFESAATTSAWSSTML